MKIVKTIQLKMFIFTAVKNRCLLHGHFFFVKTRTPCLYVFHFRRPSERAGGQFCHPWIIWLTCGHYGRQVITCHNEGDDSLFDQLV